MNRDNSLGILIPTRNRGKYLNTLLEVLMKQTLNLNVNVYVRDNKSTDDTFDIVEKYQGIYTNLFYMKNEINVGADVNFLLMINSCIEDYFWIFGDDEILLPDGLLTVIHQLTFSPDYLILEKNERKYYDFHSYVEKQFSTNPFNLIQCTLITSNIIKKSVFDLDFASAKLTTHYGHMYGIAKSLSDISCKIITINNSVFRVRTQRALPVDNDWPKNLEKEWIEYLVFLSLSNNLPYPWLKVFIIKTFSKIKSKSKKFISYFLSRRIKKIINKYLTQDKEN